MRGVIIFYKYYSSTGRGKENLEKNIICFSDIDKFNDPFEGIGKYLYSREQLISWDSFAYGFSESAVEHFNKRFRNDLKFKHRVWCVAETNTNKLMWAHYAESHAGFCVGYTEENIRKVCNKFERVAYCENPTVIDIQSETATNEIEKLLFQKDTSWAYENEWRALYTLERKDVKSLNPNDNFYKTLSSDDPKTLYNYYGNKGLGNLSVFSSPRFIKMQCPPSEVYLGLRTSEQDKEFILEICKKEKIPVFQMIQARDSFELDSVSIFEPG